VSSTSYNTENYPFKCNCNFFSFQMYPNVPYPVWPTASLWIITRHQPRPPSSFKRRRRRQRRRIHHIILVHSFLRVQDVLCSSPANNNNSICTIKSDKVKSEQTEFLDFPLIRKNMDLQISIFLPFGTVALFFLGFMKNINNNFVCH